MSSNTKDIATRVAIQHAASSGTELSSVIQHGATQARIAMDQLEDAIQRGLDLINDSTHKEHIYAEAGDMITSVKGLLQEIRDGVSVVSYAAAQIETKKLRNDIPVHIKEKIDTAVKKDT